MEIKAGTKLYEVTGLVIQTLTIVSSTPRGWLVELASGVQEIPPLGEGIFLSEEKAKHFLINSINGHIRQYEQDVENYSKHTKTVEESMKVYIKQVEDDKQKRIKAKREELNHNVEYYNKKIAERTKRIDELKNQLKLVNNA